MLWLCVNLAGVWKGCRVVVAVVMGGGLFWEVISIHTVQSMAAGGPWFRVGVKFPPEQSRARRRSQDGCQTATDRK